MWSSEELEQVGRARELEIAARRSGGRLKRFLPIWVVCVGNEVYVRTWYRRDDGWFGTVLDSRRARIRVPGLELDVAVEDAGEQADLRAGVDNAYREKYGSSGDSSVAGMVSDKAAAATLRLTPDRTPH